MKKIFSFLNSPHLLLALLTVFVLSGLSQVAWGQCLSGGQVACTTDDDCRISSCPSCWTCQNLFCEPDDTVCDNFADNMCIEAVCLDPADGPFGNATGCEYTAAATGGVAGLGEICYYCDPPELSSIDTCGNGVCNQDLENCTTCPEDCVVPGFQGVCPVDPNTVEPFICEFGITFPGPPFNTFFGQNCEDGDVCTQDTCAFVGADACVSQPLTCSQDTSDLCCASGCQGPPPGLTCRDADPTLPIGQCDIDCWPPQICGDGFVQAPETCDGSIPVSGSAGINVSDQQCRTPGQPDECTYCGDGIIDTQTEQCDGTNAAACAGLGCDVNCQCNPPPLTNFCLTGSGGLIDGSLNSDCKCSLNKEAVSSGTQDHVLILGLLGILMAGLIVRRRLS